MNLLCECQKYCSRHSFWQNNRKGDVKKFLFFCSNFFFGLLGKCPDFHCFNAKIFVLSQCWVIEGLCWFGSAPEQRPLYPNRVVSLGWAKDKLVLVAAYEKRVGAAPAELLEICFALGLRKAEKKRFARAKEVIRRAKRVRSQRADNGTATRLYNAEVGRLGLRHLSIECFHRSTIAPGGVLQHPPCANASRRHQSI